MSQANAPIPQSDEKAGRLPARESDGSGALGAKTWASESERPSAAGVALAAEFQSFLDERDPGRSGVADQGAQEAAGEAVGGVLEQEPAYEPWLQEKQRAPFARSTAWAELDGDALGPEEQDALEEAARGDAVLGSRSSFVHGAENADDEEESEEEMDARQERETQAARAAADAEAKKKTAAAKDKTWSSLFARWPSADATPESESLSPVWRLWIRNEGSSVGRARFLDALKALSAEELQTLSKLSLAAGSVWVWTPNLRAEIERGSISELPKSPPTSPVCALAALVAFASVAGQISPEGGVAAACVLGALGFGSVFQSLARSKNEQTNANASAPLSRALNQWGPSGAALILARANAPSSAEAAQWAPDGWGQTGELAGLWAVGEQANAAMALEEEPATEPQLQRAFEAARRGHAPELLERAWLLRGAARSQALSLAAWPGLNAKERWGFVASIAVAVAGFAVACAWRAPGTPIHSAAAVAGLVGIVAACVAVAPAAARVRKARLWALGKAADGAAQ